MNNSWHWKIPSKPLLLSGTLAEMLLRTWERPRQRHPFSEFLLGPVEGKGQFKFQQIAAGILLENMFIRSLGHHYYHQDLLNILQVKLKLEQRSFKILFLCIKTFCLFQSFQWLYTPVPPSFEFWAFTLFREAEKKEILPYEPICTWKSKNNKSSLKNNHITSKKCKWLWAGPLLFPLGTLL